MSARSLACSTVIAQIFPCLSRSRRVFSSRSRVSATDYLAKLDVERIGVLEIADLHGVDFRGGLYAVSPSRSGMTRKPQRLHIDLFRPEHYNPAVAPHYDRIAE